MFRCRGLPGFVLFFCLVPVFAQTPAVRGPDLRLVQDYVGQISQSFRPEIAAMMRNIGEELEQRGQRAAAQGIENYLQGNCGAGVVYVTEEGANYIITNHRIISQAGGLSITFEKPDGSRITYTGLSIVAADEEKDIALLAFENGERPFSTGLPLLDRQLWMDERVYAAGFPGTAAAWQEGEISELYVRVPGNDEIMRMTGPYIRHTAPVDSENSGGPLLVENPRAPGGYAVAGINTLSTRDREANYAIPADRVEDFLQEALGTGDGRLALEERLLAFTQGLTTSRLSYRHIAKYLSNSFTVENAEPALMLLFENASGSVIENTMRAFNFSPPEGMNLAAAWAVENYLENKHIAALDAETIEQLNLTHYYIGFNGAVKGSEWVDEYGIWRIRRISEFVPEGPEGGEEPESPLRTSYLFSLSAGYAYIFAQGHALALDISFYLWQHLGLGTQIYYGGPSYLQGEGALGFYLPIRIKDRFGITPFVGIGGGFIWKDRVDGGGTNLNSETKIFDLCISGQGGLRFSLVRGLFLQGMYQYNYEIYPGVDKPNPHTVTVSIGYGF
jgi:serine protease Do